MDSKIRCIAKDIRQLWKRNTAILRIR